MRSPLPASLSTRFLFPICVFPGASRSSSRLSSRHAVSLCVSFLCVPSARRPARRPSCRPSCRPSDRLACLSRRLVSYGRHSILLSARSRLVRRGVIALSLSCRLVGLGVPHLFIVPSLPVSSARLVSVGSFSLVISSGFIRERLGSALVPGSRVRAVLSCSSLVPVRYPSRFMPPSWGRAVRHGHDGGGACSRPSHPSHHLLLLATRSLVAGWIR